MAAIQSPTSQSPGAMMSDLVAISRRYGGDPAFVLAGGGNTSYKKGNRLWVKASGHSLATIGPDGFVELDRNALQNMLVLDWPTDAQAREALFIERVMASRTHPELKQRPIVEALIHHLLPDDLVVHTHPGIVNALTCCQGGEKLAADLMGDEILWQEYVDPGVILAQTLQRSLLQYRRQTGRAPLAILLANHGLIVSGGEAQSIAKTSDRLVERIRAHILQTPSTAWTTKVYESPPECIATYSEAISKLMPNAQLVADKSEAIIRLAGTQSGRDAVLAGPLTPDQIVYCRSVPMWIENPTPNPAMAERQLRQLHATYVQTHGFEPWVLLIAGGGMIAFRDTPNLAEVTRTLFVDAAAVYHNAARLGGVHVLSARDRQFIEQWEVEAYRRSVIVKAAR